MNEIKIFKNERFGNLRTVEINGEPWFVAKDVCDALGYEKARNAVATHVESDDALKQGVIDSMGREQDTTVINESGVYALAFGSKLESAKDFKRWVTRDVIPAIRKHGGYLTPQKIEEVLLNPDTIISLATQLKTERELTARQSAALAEQKPKVEYFDTVTNATGLTGIRETAKLFGVKEADLKQLLLDTYLYRTQTGKMMPRAEYMTAEKPAFEVCETVIKTKSGDFTRTYTKITPRGRQLVHAMCVKKGLIVF